MKGFVFSVSAIAVLAVGTPALAADLSPSYKAPLFAGYDWTGMYLGGHLGGGWASVTDQEALPFPSNFFPAGTIFNSTRATGFLGGIQGGVDRQFSNWVIGLAGDYAWSDARSTETTASPTTLGVSSTVNGRMVDIGLLTGRLGYAANNWLFYVNGGGALGTFSSNGSAVLNGVTTTTFSSRATQTGWTVGGGVEWAFLNNWSAKVEYNHLDFGTKPVTVTGVSGVDAGVLSTVNSRTTVDIVKAGLNYRFSLPGM